MVSNTDESCQGCHSVINRHVSSTGDRMPSALLMIKMSCFVVGANITCVAWRQIVCMKRGDVNNYEIIRLPKNRNGIAMLVNDISLSEDECYIAILTQEKCLLVYDCKTLALLKQHAIARAASKVRFAPDASRVLVADKTGDAYLCNWKETDSECVKILGHLSLLLDVLMTPSSQYIISCDRDEKIRVSRYPNTYNIQTYCLGHKEFVLSVDLLPHNLNILLSSSGDGTLRMWNYLTGEQLHVIDCNSVIDDKSVVENYILNLEQGGFEVSSLPIWRNSCCILNSDSSLVAVSLHMWKYIIVYRIKGGVDGVESELITEVPTAGRNIDFVVTGKGLWLLDLGTGVIEQWTLFKPSTCIDTAKVCEGFPPPSQGGDLDLCHNSDNISSLYKRKFDNVQEYRERKKLRLMQGR